MDPNDFKQVKQGISELEQKLGVQKGFYDRLLHSDSDWLFVIRLHAFFEAVCTMLITKALGKEELIDVISRSNTLVKLRYIEKLAILDKGAMEFVREVAEIRNAYVHDIKSISISLEDYLKKITPVQKNTFAKKVGYGIGKELAIGGITVKRKDFILENPRFAIHLGTFSVLSDVVAHSELEKMKMREADLDRREAELHKKAAQVIIGLAKKYGLGKNEQRKPQQED